MSNYSGNIENLSLLLRYLFQVNSPFIKLPSFTAHLSNKIFFTIVIVIFVSVGKPGFSLALTPKEVLVVANFNAADSLELALYYMKKRGIPDSNLIKLWVDDKEKISRKDYDEQIADPVRNFLKSKGEKRGIKCIVTMYGVPLTILPYKKKAPKNKSMSNSNLIMEDENSSVDSELSLVLLPDHDVGGWIPNPYFIASVNKRFMISKSDVLMVSRLDGPSEKIVRRIIDDSIETEARGLSGRAYLDARWSDKKGEKGSAYQIYDRSLHKAAKRIEESGLIEKVILEQSEELFQSGDGVDVALYSGWYSLGRYIDAFSWQKGAIGYHIASSECVTLKSKRNRGWCKMMLEKGVSATLGPVGEPYVQAFPPPEIFFSLILDGKFTLAESYILSLPYLSWKMVLIGDPLYRPFKNFNKKKISVQID